MNSLEVLEDVLFWCLIINFSLLFMSFVAVVFAFKKISKFHGTIFDLDENYLRRAYFNWIAQYKALIIVFNLVPYIALVIVN